MGVKRPNNDMRWIGLPLVLAALTLLVLQLGAASKASRTAPPTAGAPKAPAWELKDLDGTIVRSKDLAGRVVVLNFWATWCGVCRAELPNLIRLQKEYHDRGLTVVGVSFDDAAPAVMKEFVKRSGINYPVLFADEAVDQAFGGIEAVPTTVVIDRHGRIVSQHVGYLDFSELKREVEVRLNQRAPARPAPLTEAPPTAART